jgi:hypothetical protein
MGQPIGVGLADAKVVVNHLRHHVRAHHDTTIRYAATAVSI